MSWAENTKVGPEECQVTKKSLRKLRHHLVFGFCKQDKCSTPWSIVQGLLQAQLSEELGAFPEATDPEADHPELEVFRSI